MLLTVTYAATALFSHASNRQILRIRNMYFRSALRQDIGWYDLNSTGDFASRMSEWVPSLLGKAGNEKKTFW